MLPYLSGKFGNAGSRSHIWGRHAAQAVERARQQVAQLLGAGDPAREIVFTSGATESNNLAIKGLARRLGKVPGHIVTQKTEHKAVLDTCKRLENEGHRVTYLDVDGQGFVSPAAVSEAMHDDTVLVSIMLANNEVGSVQPVEEIGTLTRERGVLFHCDAVQGVGRTAFDVSVLPVDLVSVSSHKLYGPMGVGALFVRRGVGARMLAEMDGGGQERGLRSGTLNVPAIVGFGAACELLSSEADAENVRLGALRERLLGGLRESVGGLHINGTTDWSRRHPGNLNVSFDGVDGEALLVALSRSVGVSSGAACSSATMEPSYVLRAMGIDDDRAHGSVRFGIGRGNTPAEIDQAVRLVAAQVQRIRALG